MKYEIVKWTIQSLIDGITNSTLNLKPPFQRNFIWTPSDQMELIESINSNYPLPTFFLFQHPNGTFDMVDGQQRTRTIFRFYSGVISTKSKVKYSPEEFPDFLNYSISVTIIKQLELGDSLELFYSRVNKTGKMLNNAELNKAEFAHTKFLALVEELTEDQRLKDLDLFKDITIARMNDRDFVEELVALIKFGITDKKHSRDKLFEHDIDDLESAYLKSTFTSILDKIVVLDGVVPINTTRFRQKNDFYTLFSFIYFNPALVEETLIYFYRLMVFLGAHVSPSNELSDVLREYAINCVSQSNSKAAREVRLRIWSDLLLNVTVVPNICQLDVIKFLETIYDIEKVELMKIDKYLTFNFNELKNLKERV
jgi:uncharacterized protein with ParB-like and HNH nuclease domain